MAEKKSNKRLIEITNTPKSKKFAVEEIEKCYVTKDEEIMDLKIGISDSDLFEDFQVDMKELRFINKIV